MKSWVEFWNSDHSIYVNDRHKALHAAAIGRDIIRQIPGPDAVVLDHGCGEALYAEAVAARCARLMLCEAAPAVRDALAQRLAHAPGIEVVAADGLERLADGALDLVIANSLAQYLDRGEFEALLVQWRGKLKPSGRLILADIIPPDVSPARDALALARFGWSGGFLTAAMVGLARTAVSDYRRVRAALGFAMYREGEMLALLAARGFAAERVRPNFGHNQARMTFCARPDTG